MRSSKTLKTLRPLCNTYAKKLKQQSETVPLIQWVGHEFVCHETLRKSPFFNLEVRSATNSTWSEFKIVKTLNPKRGFDKIEDLRALEKNTYYIPANSQQPVIDAFAYTTSNVRNIDATEKRKMLLIQATVARQHRPKKERLNEIVSHLCKLVPGNVKSVQWYFIFYISNQDFTLENELTAEVVGQGFSAKKRRKKGREKQKSQGSPVGKKPEKVCGEPETQNKNEGEANMIRIPTFAVRLVRNS